MKKLQLYFDDDTYEKIVGFSKVAGVSASAFCANIVKHELGDDSGCEDLVMGKISEEIKYAVTGMSAGDQFSLGDVSDTYNSLPKEPSADNQPLKRKIGRNVKNQIKNGYYNNVTISLNRNGKPKKTRTNATVYEIIET